MKMLSRRFRIGGLSFCLAVGMQIVALGQGAANSNAPQFKSSDVVKLEQQGRNLSSTEAETLEKTLATDPKNLAARIELIAYYSTAHDEFFATKKSEHVLWVIRNIPDSDWLRFLVELQLHLDKGFEEAKQSWLANLETHKGNLVVLGNAVDFFRLTDRSLAEKLLKQAALADANNPRWPRELGQFYMLGIQRAPDATKRSLAASAYPQFELAYRLASSPQEKRMLLSPLATSAFEAGEIPKAQAWAQEALKQGSTTRPDFSAADSVHHAHIILGRIALRAGNLGEAREHLIQAGQSDGSPVLGSFGPNMMLAKELLEKGERDAVIRYFQICASFWKLDRGRLDQWTATVKGGGIPNFGANLAY